MSLNLPRNFQEAIRSGFREWHESWGHAYPHEAGGSNTHAHPGTAVAAEDIAGAEWDDLTDGGETALHSHASAGHTRLHLSTNALDHDDLVCSAGAGLTLNFTAGRVAFGGTSNIDVAAGSLAIDNNATRYVYVTITGFVAQAATVPAGAFVLAIVITAGGSISSVQDLRGYLSVPSAIHDYLAGVTADQHHAQAHGPSQHTEGTAWRLTYQNASGDETEIVLGADGTFLESNGASAAPAFRALAAADLPAASQTAQGAVELATAAEINTGTDTTRAMPVDQFVASNRNVRYILIRVLDPATAHTVTATVGGDVEVPFTGTITEIGAYVDTAGVTGTATIDVNKNGTTLMTTNKITIDSAEKSSRTAATAPALTTTAVAAGDLLTVDIDALQTTAAKGLTIRLGIRQT